MKLLILGATGAVGSALIAQALKHPKIDQVIAPSRRPLAEHAKLTNPVTQFTPLDTAADYWRVDAVICALGTTIKQAGSKQAFTYVDRDLPLAIATLTRSLGANSFALNSSLGAKRGKNFYLNTKAEVEQGIAALNFNSFTIVRPSLINTQRTQARIGEQLGLWFAAIFKPLIPKRYRPVTPTAIAEALLHAVVEPMPGVHIIESEHLL
ncbi:oxidoreductase [Simiduia litorea]|uniref:NAD(P)H-binding protein n=1 Tax=Simiduia litorea TaxID=1435348 RepID=UPI0036F2FE22